MKTSKTIFIYLTVFYFIVAVVYTYWTWADTGRLEWVGVVAFALMAVFSIFLGWYFSLENKPFKNRPLPEDREDAEQWEAESELGFFSPWSWWPIVLSACIAVAMLGAATGWWLVFFAFPLVIISIMGWTYEYYRGRFAH